MSFVIYIRIKKENTNLSKRTDLTSTKKKSLRLIFYYIFLKKNESSEAKAKRTKKNRN